MGSRASFRIAAASWKLTRPAAARMVAHPKLNRDQHRVRGRFPLLLLLQQPCHGVPVFRWRLRWPQLASANSITFASVAGVTSLRLNGNFRAGTGGVFRMDQTERPGSLPSALPPSPVVAGAFAKPERWTAHRAVPTLFVPLAAFERTDRSGQTCRAPIGCEVSNREPKRGVHRTPGRAARQPGERLGLHSVSAAGLRLHVQPEGGADNRVVIPGKRDRSGASRTA